MTKNEDLKACPWCNGKAYINNFKSQPCQLHGDRETMWRIQCKHKDAKWMDSSSLPECHVKPVVVASTREEAIERWNTRPTVTPSDTAMEDAAQREPAGCTGTTGATAASVGITSSTTDGDAEMPVHPDTAVGFSEFTKFRDNYYEWAVKNYAAIKTALQSTRKPPTEGK